MLHSATVKEKAIQCYDAEQRYIEAQRVYLSVKKDLLGFLKEGHTSFYLADRSLLVEVRKDSLSMDKTDSVVFTPIDTV